MPRDYLKTHILEKGYSIKLIGYPKYRILEKWILNKSIGIPK